MDDGAAEILRFKSRLEPIIDHADGLFLVCEGSSIWLPDRIFSALAPLLGGTHNVEEIFEALADEYAAEDTFAALDYLRTTGFLTNDPDLEARPLAAFWEHAGVSPRLARSRLDVARVSAIAVGEVEIGPLVELLAGNGLAVAPASGFTVLVTDDYLRPELATWNARSLASGQPWILVKPVGIETWIGPLFVPGRTACWECLAHRLRGHRKVESYLGRGCGPGSLVRAPSAAIPSTRLAAFTDTVTEVTRWVGSGGHSILLDRVLSTNVVTLERAQHVLTKRPQCPSCGAPVANEGLRPRPVHLLPRPKSQASDGGHRAHNIGDVLAQLDRHLSPITGIVSALAAGERTGAADGRGGRWLTPTFAADHNFSDMHDVRFFLREGMRRRSGGKGKSVQQARVSALAESLERYCGVFDGSEPRIRSSLAALGEAAIHPNACMTYSERQYAERETRNQTGHKAEWVPEPFEEGAEIEWTPLWSLSSERTRYLPTSYCYFGYHSTDPIFARADSNGCAAGSVMEEAVLQGFLELVERDAVAIWWYNRLPRPAVDLASSLDPYISELVSHYGELRRELWALDVTSDLGIPTFAALSRRVDKSEEDIIYGFGTHLDPDVALSRAVTEVNQSLEAVPSATGPESSRTYRGGPDAVRWWRTVRADEAGYLMPDPAAASRRLQDFRNLASNDLCNDVNFCLGVAASRGIEVLVLDQSRPDVGLPVARVVAPGLRHFWARFGSGRLYDVPLRLGWHSRSLSEEELNPFVIQF